MQFGARFQF